LTEYAVIPLFLMGSIGGSEIDNDFHMACSYPLQNPAGKGSGIKKRS
jgi:hypothetical protein